MKKKILAVFPAIAVAFSSLGADPFFRFASSGEYLPAGQTQLPYESCDVTNVTVQLYRAYGNNVVLYGKDAWSDTGRMALAAEKEVVLEPPYGETKKGMLNLADILGREPECGGWCVCITGQRYVSRYGWSTTVSSRRSFSISDLGVVAFFDEGGDFARVAVHSLTDGSCVPGAKVTAVTYANQIAGEGFTGEDGCAEIRFAPAFDSKRDWVKRLVVSRGADSTALDFDSDNREKERYAALNKFVDPRAAMWAARDIARPGERMDVSAIVRNSIASGNAPLAKAPVDFVLVDPRGDTCGRKRVVTDDTGFASCAWELPRNAKTGEWSVRLESGGSGAARYSFRVAAYQPDRVKATLKSAAKSIVGVDSGLEFAWDAKYYFGPDARSGDWDLRVTGSLAEAPPHWKGWACDTRPGNQAMPYVKEFTQKGSLDDAERNVAMPPLSALSEEDVSPICFWAALNVSAEGERTVTARAEAFVFPLRWYYGCREVEDPSSDKKRVEFAVLPAIKDDAIPSPEADVEAELSLARCEWRRVVSKGRSGVLSVDWQEVEVEHPELERKLTILAGTDMQSWRGSVEWPAHSLEAGRWILRVRQGGKVVSSMDFWHSAGEASARSISPAALNFVCDAKSFLPGETARITFKSPVDGIAHLAAGWRGIDAVRTFEVKRGENSFELQVPADTLGRQYCAEMVVVSRAEPQMRRLAGSISISVDQATAHKLAVEVETANVVTPDAKSVVRVKVRDSKGVARKAKVQVMATDMGVLALTGFRTPDPFTRIHGFAYGLPFEVFDLYSSIFPDIKILPNGEFGGDLAKAMMAMMKSRQMKDGTLDEPKTATFMLDPVETDDAGIAEIEIPGANITGALRVMAVAWDAACEGSADAELIVRDKISARIMAPRFAVAGDTFEIAAAGFDNDLPAAACRFELEWPGDKRVFEATLEPGSETNFFARVTIPDDFSGKWATSLVMTSQGLTSKDRAVVAVRPAQPAETEISYSLGDASLPPTEEDWIDGTEVVTEYSTPAATLASALDWLEEYPYGCLEQVCAKAFPFLAADELKALSLIDDKRYAQAKERVEAALAEIRAMARHDGGYGMWPWSEETWRSGSLFAHHLVAEAVAKDWADGAHAQLAKQYLRSVASDASTNNMLHAAYASYILAGMDDMTFAVSARNLLAAEQADDAVRFLAAAALVRGGFKSEGEAPLLAALGKRFWSKTETFPLGGGRARELGQILFIASRLGVDGTLLAPLVAELNGLVRGDSRAWGTTADNAWAAAGLATAAVRCDFGEVKLRKIVRVGVRKVPSPPREGIRISRRITDRDGVERSVFSRGDLARMVIDLEPGRYVESAVLSALVPAGFEIEDCSLKTRERADGKADAVLDGFSVPYGRSDIRDDRWLWFGSLSKGVKYRLTFNMRAAYRGESALPAVSVEDMYDPDLAGDVSCGGEVSVK